MAFTSPLKSLFFLSTRGISLFFFLNKTIRNNKKRGDKLLMRKTARTPCVCVCVSPCFFFRAGTKVKLFFLLQKEINISFCGCSFFLFFTSWKKFFFSFYLLFSPPMASQCFRTSIKRREEEEEEDKVYVSPCCVDSKSLASHAAER